VYITSRSFGKFHEEPVKKLKEVAEVIFSPYNRALKEEEMEGIVKGIDALIVGDDPVTRKIMDASDKLKIIAKHGVGLDKIDINAATEKGIYVTFTPEAVSDSVADHVFGLILALARKIPHAHYSTKSGMWESKKFMGIELPGKILGLFGFGKIGRKVAQRAVGFGMKILINVRHPEKVKKEMEELGAKYIDKETLLKTSDIIVVLIPLTSETKGFIGREELNYMKKNSLLINAARGPIVDEKALYDALKEGKIAGAALDVYSEEPPGSDFPLFKLDNVVVTPHIAGYTYEANYKMDMMNVEDILKVFKGEKPVHLVNPEVVR
jgi:D-3-phosphoglycerate dehydrogenase